MASVEIKLDSTNAHLLCQGDWTLEHIAELKHRLQSLLTHHSGPLNINASDINKMDSAGGLLLHQVITRCNKGNKPIVDFSASERVKKILKLVSDNLNHQQLVELRRNRHSLITVFGKRVYQKWQQCLGFLNLLGELSYRFCRALFDWKRFHFGSVMRVIDIAGLQALPILALLLFLIGVVLAYQMGLQLKTYGANIYIVYLTGMAIEREFAPLITSIIVAGRTSSSFTAQIGSMKINEEIDAITVMGLAPAELLILPKVIGMILIFPILFFWADVFGTLGAMLMAKNMLDIGYVEFMLQLKESLGVKQYLLGLAKAPVFALIIAMVGCFQGTQVKGSANSVGFSTTRSVVQAIFLIIVTDALFSIIYTALGL